MELADITFSMKSTRDFMVKRDWLPKPVLWANGQDETTLVQSWGSRSYDARSIRPQNAVLAELPVDVQPLRDFAASTAIKISKFICFDFRGDIRREDCAMQLDPAAFLNFGAAAGEDDKLLAFAATWGRLYLDGPQFNFGLCSFDDFVARFENDEAGLDQLSRLPYLEDWRSERLGSVYAERLSSWRHEALELQLAVDLHRSLVKSEDEASSLALFKAAILGEQVPTALAPMFGTRWESLKSFACPDLSEVRNPVLSGHRRETCRALWPAWKATQEKKGFANAVMELLLNHTNSKIAGGASPVFRRRGVEMVPHSLLVAMWLQLGNLLSGEPEFFTCSNCGRWFNVAGKARGREKKTCSNSCRVRLYQKRKAAAQGG